MTYKPEENRRIDWRLVAAAWLAGLVVWGSAVAAMVWTA